MGIDAFINIATKTKAKSKQVLEVNIEDAFVKYAKRKKCLATKLIFLNKRGWPDRTVLCPGGIVFFIEFKKSNKEKLSATQIPIKRLIEGFGFKYFVCNTPGQAEKLLDEIVK